MIVCMTCGAVAEKGTTPSVTDTGDCLIIVRNVPCYKCSECSEIIYSGDVVQQLEKIIKAAKELSKTVSQEIAIVEYTHGAA